MDLAVDYFSQKYNTLFVTAGANAADAKLGNAEAPADAYDVLVVGASQRSGSGDFDQRNTGYTDLYSADGRRLTHLLAPGTGIRMPSIGAGESTSYALGSGSSYAAPHATAVVALLADYVARNANTVDARAKRHEVMKVILLNSADVVKGALGMTKDVRTREGFTWEKSEARDTDDNPAGKALPLDMQFGAGLLDASRALRQLQGGRYAPGAQTVGEIGWDYNQDKIPANGRVVYKLPTLKGSTWVSASLTWDRIVQFSTGNQNRPYSTGDTFTAQPLANLDLVLQKVLPDGTTQEVWRSNSTKENVERIFRRLSADDAQYELVVENHSNVATTYAIAWWTKAAGSPPENAHDIRGYVWDDDNQDALQTTGEHGVEGVTVHLIDWVSGVTLDTRETDSTGHYEFPVADGMYYLQFAAPRGDTFTEMDYGPDDTIDSDVTSNGSTAPVWVSGADVEHMDAGLLKLTPGSIGGYAWRDLDHDGTWDAGESSMADVEVNLYTSEGEYVDSVHTDNQGWYEFNDVAPDSYQVGFVSPTNYSHTVLGYDSSADPATGLTPVWTIPEGGWKYWAAGFEAVHASIGNYVWNDKNRNTVQDSNEWGVVDQTVVLRDASGSEVDRTYTDEDGYYEFDELPPGTYTVQFLPDSTWGFTVGGPTQTVTVTAGQTNNAVDAGLAAASVGNFVWSDTNGNGIQDSGEPGLGGIVLFLTVWNGLTGRLEITI